MMYLEDWQESILVLVGCLNIEPTIQTQHANNLTNKLNNTPPEQQGWKEKHRQLGLGEGEKIIQ